MDDQGFVLLTAWGQWFALLLLLLVVVVKGRPR
jgi:hypothetical protein